MLLWIAVAGKEWIAYHWVTGKKSSMALTNQWRSYNFDKLRKEESSLSYKVIARENVGSHPSCEWKWGAQGDWGLQPFVHNHNPQGDRKPEWSAQTEPPTVTKGAIHSTKIQTGKSGPPQKMGQFFRNFSGWTEPIHWVLDRNFRKFWSNGSRPKVLASKPASTFGSNACADLGYRWTMARPSASTPTRMLPNAIKALHNLERCWQQSCSWSLTTLNYI